ncbi:MAG: L,D-transpeptidase family protein [Williamsia sp.]|nr:L,D-transpeptidase family protein [Williamsia sp.]
MKCLHNLVPVGMFFSLFLFVCSCKNSGKPPEKDIVSNEEQLDERVSKDLKKTLDYAEKNHAQINDSTTLASFRLVNAVYDERKYQSIWSQKDGFESMADSLYLVVEHAKEWGLFPEDYHYKSLQGVWSRLKKDSASQKDAALWTKADVLLTEAYFTIARHLKLGRLSPDSVTLKKDSIYNDAFFIKNFNEATSKSTVINTLQNLEPKYPGYQRIKSGIKSFLDSANFKPYTYIIYPYKDSLQFITSLRKRLAEDGFLPNGATTMDSATLAGGIQSYQRNKNLTATGKITESLIRVLNNTDWEKFKTVAVTLDRYKLLPDTIPATYVLVNLPAYTLYVYDEDTLALQSRVIVGSPRTKTPLLNSAISNFITYPQWTVPYSIIFKEMLPRIQRNISYLERQNLMVVNGSDEVVDPYKIDWSKLNSKHFPYLIRQREGDDNSLGVIKFNFRNKYSVYLHDTNVRWQFNRAARAISHGCVRVERWEELSHFLVRADTVRFPPDTLRAWMSRQEKHMVTGFPKVPLFIRYLTTDGKDGKLVFYSDIYGYDRQLKEKYFSGKQIS